MRLLARFLFEDSLVIVYFWFVQVLFLLSCAMAVLYCWIADRIKLKIVTLVFICTCFLGINIFLFGFVLDFFFINWNVV